MQKKIEIKLAWGVTIPRQDGRGFTAMLNAMRHDMQDRLPRFWSLLGIIAIPLIDALLAQAGGVIKPGNPSHLPTTPQRRHVGKIGRIQHTFLLLPLQNRAPAVLSVQRIYQTEYRAGCPSLGRASLHA